MGRLKNLYKYFTNFSISYNSETHMYDPKIVKTNNFIKQFFCLVIIGTDCHHRPFTNFEVKDVNEFFVI